MPDLGLEVLLKGKNMVRLLGGLGVALKISAVSVLLSLPLGILLGVLMTFKNPILKAILRVYLEFIRIMPQMVLLFLVYFGTTRAFGWNLSGETAAVIVFVLWGTAEMSDLVRGALIAIPKHQYESSEALGMSRAQTYWYWPAGPSACWPVTSKRNGSDCYGRADPDCRPSGKKLRWQDQCSG